MSNYKVILSPLKDIASRQRLKKFYTHQKDLKSLAYYLLPSMKWLQTARKRQPGIAFKTFDDIADLILKKTGISYVSITEAERDLFFQQLLSGENGEVNQNAHKAKAYSQTYGQLMRLGLTLKDLPTGLTNLKPALKKYEDEWVKEKRLLDPENRFHEALNLQCENLPLGHVTIDGYMDFSPLQYQMLICLMKHKVPISIYLPAIKETEIINETISNLKEIGFMVEGDFDNGYREAEVSVSKAVTKEEEIRGALNSIIRKLSEGENIENIGIILADESYKKDLIRLAGHDGLQIQVPQKVAVTESNMYKTIALILKQSSFSSKWEKIPLIDQLYQILFTSRDNYWESKRTFMLSNKLPLEIHDRLEKCVSYKRRFPKTSSLVEEIDGLIAFMDDLNLTDIWADKILKEENTEFAQKIRNEWMAYDTLIDLLKGKKKVLTEQGLEHMNINLNIFSQWFYELVRKKEIYVERKPARGLNLYTFREAALFRGDTLYVLGLNEGVFPAIHKVSGYFQESDLKSLTGVYGVPSKATFRRKDEGTFKQLYYIADNLYFSYVCGFDPENEYQPSPFIESFCSNPMLLSAEQRYKEQALTRLGSYEQTAYMLGMGKKVVGAPKEMLNMVEHLDFLQKGEEKVCHPLTQGLVSNKVGATTLEQYAACPFRYGMERLLKIEEPKAKEESLNPLYTGSMIHTIIERFYTNLGVIGKPFRNLSDEKKNQGENILFAIFNEEWEKVESQHNDMSVYDLELEKSRWSNMLKKWWIAEKKRFWDNEKLKDMQIFKLEEHIEHPLRIDDEETLTLVGKVDRIDTDNEGFVIYDYKSGNASLKIKEEVETGLKLQLPLYIWVIQNKIKLTAHGASYISLMEPQKRAKNGIWCKDNVGTKGRFNVSSVTNKEDTLEGEALMTKYKLKEKIIQLWKASNFDYSVKPLKCHNYCPYDGVCRVTDELKEEGENGNGRET